MFAQEKSEKLKINTVVIDAGHGGKDPGTVSKLGYEKDLVLDICLKVGDYIKELIPDVKVVYTRDKDVFVDLYKRADIANDVKADLFISIHANGVESTKADGTETFVLGLHRSKENFDRAMKENSVILIEDDYEQKYEGFDPNSPESYIIFSLLQNVFLDQSLILASHVQNQFRERVHRKDRGVKQAGLVVLARTSMPSILIEVGFISNPEEATFLFSDQGKDYMASAIYRAFRDYKDSYEGNIPENKDTENATEEKTDTISNEIEESKIIEKETAKNDSIYFKVQILTSKEKIELTSDNFNGLSNVEEILVDDIHKYFVGNTTDYDKCIDIQKETKEKIKGAFIVAFKNGKKIDLKEALKEINR